VHLLLPAAFAHSCGCPVPAAPARLHAAARQALQSGNLQHGSHCSCISHYPAAPPTPQLLQPTCMMLPGNTRTRTYTRARARTHARTHAHAHTHTHTHTTAHHCTLALSPTTAAAHLHAAAWHLNLPHVTHPALKVRVVAHTPPTTPAAAAAATPTAVAEC
jgi:hypothetical protein